MLWQDYACGYDLSMNRCKWQRVHSLLFSYLSLTLIRLTRSWGSYAVVEEPESLRNEIKAEAEKISEKYTKRIKHKEKLLMA
jgi:hypothetical protein